MGSFMRVPEWMITDSDSTTDHCGVRFNNADMPDYCPTVDRNAESPFYMDDRVDFSSV